MTLQVTVPGAKQWGLRAELQKLNSFAILNSCSTVCAFTGDVNEVSLSSVGKLVVYHACEAILYTHQTNESLKYNAALHNERNFFFGFVFI